MSRLTSRSMASVIAVAAIAAAGCGSSSKSKTSTPAAPSTPAATTPATPSTTTTTPTNVSASAPIGGSAFRAVLLTQAEKNGAPASKAPQFVDCLVRQLQDAGIKTAGDFKNNQSKAKPIVQTCNKQVGVNVRP